MKMHFWARLHSLCLLIYLSAVALGDPPFPKLREMAESFESSVELTDMIQEITVLAKEYYNFADQTGRLETLAVGLPTTYYFNGSSNQIFEVNDTSCTQLDAGTAEIDTNFYGWISEKPLFVGPSALILKAENGPVEFVREASVRGISCNWFRYRGVNEYGGNVTVDFLFSVPKWDMPYRQGNKEQPFPVKIVVINGAEMDYDMQTIDFLYFHPKFNDQSKFQPPVGLGCWMKEPIATLPAVPKQYTYSAEIFDLLRTLDADILSSTVWYDYALKYGRLDRYWSSVGKISDLSDFKTGVMYHMHDDRTCVFKTMRNSFFLKHNKDSLIGEMKEPKEILNLQDDEHDFYHMGQAEIRGIKCNVYEKVERNYELDDVKYTMLVTTAYFATDSVKIQIDGEYIDFSPPVQVLLTGYAAGPKVILKKQYEIFSFNDEPGKDFFSTYPSAECFPKSNQKSYFIIRIDAPIEIARELEGKDFAFADLARNTIIRTANITEFRLPFLRADFRESGIYLTGQMLDRPPLVAQFWKEFKEKTFVTTVSAYEMILDATDEESCAAACLGYTEPCKGFHLCGTGACFINLGEIQDEPVDNLPINADCYIYIRAVTDSANDQASLEQAIKNLATATDDKKLKFRAKDKNDEDLLTATEFVASLDNRGGDNPNNYPYNLVKAGFQFKAASEVETTVEVPEAQSEQECYRRCKESTDISCASFSYCAKASNKMCRLTSVLLGDDPKDNNEINPNVRCDIFSLLFLDFFDVFPGRVVTIPGDKTAPDAYNTESCAKACKEETSFKCRGFEYCRSKSACTLHSKHVLDLKPDQSISTTGDCVHYSAKYIADYRDMGYLLIDDQNMGRRESINLEECAFACSEELPSCNSFSYCPSSMPGATDNFCSLTTYTLYNAPKTKTSGNCHLYTKRENIEDWKPAPPAKTKSGYTSKGFTGLAFGMIILGLIVGALLFVAYSYYRSRSGGGDGLTVKFSKQENS